MTKRFRLSWNMRKIRRRIALVKEKMKVVEDYGRENSILSDSAPTYVKITESCISLIEPTPITENPKLLVLDSTESHAKQESKGASEGKGTKNIMSKIDTCMPSQSHASKEIATKGNNLVSTDCGATTMLGTVGIMGLCSVQGEKEQGS
ncbi:hypothetical protein ACOSP7_020360 [Xanthoceras sorbifolium]